ncbi:hypothetical protein B0T19DRAFT_435343 [Cercophora scortea]|uniref:Uncharacterized protein n=1 Tax=Cercophora scortea TaxID=314031 RepID=A0AAE0I2Z1_9PEZI|nr:hypothetical protein B0T19DRAFT_435343 [Cercophora scortea]
MGLELPPWMDQDGPPSLGSILAGASSRSHSSLPGDLLSSATISGMCVTTLDPRLSSAEAFGPVSFFTVSNFAEDSMDKLGYMTITRAEYHTDIGLDGLPSLRRVHELDRDFHLNNTHCDSPCHNGEGPCKPDSSDVTQNGALYCNEGCKRHLAVRERNDLCHPGCQEHAIHTGMYEQEVRWAMSATPVKCGRCEAKTLIRNLIIRSILTRAAPSIQAILKKEFDRFEEGQSDPDNDQNRITLSRM